MRKIFVFYLVILLTACSTAVFAADFGIDVTIDTGRQGNVYFEDDEQNVKILVENTSTSSKKLQITNVVKNEDGEVVYTSDTQSIELRGYQRKNLNFGLEFERFGFYTLEVNVSDLDKNEKVFTTRFSHSKKASIKNKEFGFNATNFSAMSGAFDLIDNSGLGSVRTSAVWSAIEQKNGIYNVPASIDKFINSAYEKGIDVLLLLGAGNSLYNLVNENSGRADDWTIFPKIEGVDEEKAEQAEEQLKAYENYAYNIASKYKDKVCAYQVWNEPINNSENMTKSRAYDFAALQQAAYDGVKAADSSAIVCGLCLNKVYTNKCTQWFGHTLDAGAADNMDILTLHTYSASNPPEIIPDANNKGIVFHMNRYFDVLESRKTGIDNIWVTEYGWSTGLGEDGNGCDTYAPEELQGAYLIRHFILNAANNPKGRHFIYNFENSGLDITQREHNFGLVKNRESEIPYEAKPSYLAVSNFNSLVGGADGCEAISNTDGKYVYKFTLPGRNVYAMWSTADTYCEAEFNHSAEFYDIYGNEIEGLSYNDGSYKIGETPIYVVESFETVTYDGEVVTYKGCVGEKYKKCEIQMIALKPGEKFGDVSMYLNPAYIDSAFSDENGDFTFRFKTGMAAYYNLYFCMPDGVTIKRKIKGAGTGTGEIFAYTRHEALKNASQLCEDDLLEIKAYIADDVKNAKLLLAFYENGSLRNMEFGENGDELSISKRLEDMNFDVIKVFL